MFFQLSDHHHLGFSIPPLLEKSEKWASWKINWDASIDKKQKQDGDWCRGQRFHGEDGSYFLWDQTLCIGPFMNHQQKHGAARQVVELSLKLGWRKIILEGDAL